MSPSLKSRALAKNKPDSCSWWSIRSFGSEQWCSCMCGESVQEKGRSQGFIKIRIHIFSTWMRQAGRQTDTQKERHYSILLKDTWACSLARFWDGTRHWHHTFPMMHLTLTRRFLWQVLLQFGVLRSDSGSRRLVWEPLHECGHVWSSGGPCLPSLHVLHQQTLVRAQFTPLDDTLQSFVSDCQTSGLLQTARGGLRGADKYEGTLKKSVHVCHRAGRRKSMSSFLCLSGSACFCTVLIPDNAGDTHTHSIVLMFMKVPVVPVLSVLCAATTQIVENRI